MQWLIDGHNLIGQLPNLHLDDPHDEEKLLELLRSFRGRTRDTLTVIFDPGAAYRTGKPRRSGGISVRFAARGQTADQVIMGRLRKVKNPQGVMVVSSDRAVQQAAQQARVRVMSAQEFGQLLLNPPAEVEADSRANVQLSPDEVETWLAIFNQRKS